MKWGIEMAQGSIRAVLGATLVNLLLAASLFAQGTTGTIKGQVVDQASDVNVGGTVVTLVNSRTGMMRATTANADGRFQVRLPPGKYTLETSMTGYSSIVIREVSVAVGAVAELTIPVEQSVIDEIITYGTAAPLMATATGETGLHFSLEDLARLPVERNIEAVAMMAPGTVPGVTAFGEDKTLVSFGGASVAENVYYIDGLNVTNFTDGLGGSSVPFEFYEQFQIKTGGYSAEFGRSTGGVLNAVTKRGSNEFEFGAVAYFEPEWLQGTSPDTLRPDGSYYDRNSGNSHSSTTVDLYAGGPIVRDRLFFFVLYEPQDSSERYHRRGSADTLIDLQVDDSFWGGNLTWNITDNHALSYTAFSDKREIEQTNFGFELDGETTGNVLASATNHRGGENFAVRYEGHLGDRLSVSALYGENEYNLTDRSSGDEECPVAADFRPSAPSVLVGCWVNLRIVTSNDKREAYRLDFEYSLGNHTLRAGLDREDNVSYLADTYPGLDYAPNLPGGLYYRYETWDVGAQLFNGAIVPDVNGDGAPVDTVRIRYYQFGGSFDLVTRAWYLEDVWEISDALTLSAGIRNEVFKNYNGVGELFYDIDDQWAPRLALSWTPRGEGVHHFNLNWGRYHLPLLGYPNIVAGSSYLDYLRYFVYDGNRDERTAAPITIDADGIPTTQEIGTIEYWADGTVPETRGLLDTTLEPMYQDEWMVAYERDLGEDWVVGIRYVNRELKSLIEDVTTDAGLEAIGFPGATGGDQGCWYVMTNPGTDMTTFCDSDGDGELEEWTIPADALGYPKPRRKYNAIDLTVRKHMSSGWSLQGSYTWSKNKGNTEGSVKSDNGQSAANLTEDFDLPEIMEGAYGYLPNDRRHKVRLWGIWQASDRLMLSASVFAQSGKPINTFGNTHPNGVVYEGYSTFYVQGEDGSLEFKPRGTSGRTAWVTQFDLAAVYAFDWRDWSRVELRAEVFNLFDSSSETEVYEHYADRPDQFKLPQAYQQPRQLRFGIAMRF
jgi:hypothetical protein